MAVLDLTTYDGLLAGIAGWLNRADLTDQIPTFVTMAEAKFNRDLRVRDMHVRAAATSANEFVSLPLDFLQHYSLALAPNNAARPPLKYVGPMEAETMKAADLHGPVSSYTMVANAFELLPAPTSDTDLIMVYYARIPALTTLNQSNWLSEKSPDLYLASSLMEAAPYLGDDARLQSWSAQRAALMEGVRLESEAAMRSTTQLVAHARPF